MAQEQLNRERRKWMNKCISAITASYAADLMDKWGWTPDEVNKLLSSTMNNFQNMLDKFVTIDDFIDWCKEKNINVDEQIS